VNHIVVCVVVVYIVVCIVVVECDIVRINRVLCATLALRMCAVRVQVTIGWLLWTALAERRLSSRLQLKSGDCGEFESKSTPSKGGDDTADARVVSRNFYLFGTKDSTSVQLLVGLSPVST
jgi:hypothetical protein